jgi:hypothetical protein
VYAERASNYAGTRQPTTARGVVRPTAKEEGEMVIPGTDRRFCGFNTGTVTDSCKYSDRIFSTTIDKNENVLAPLMDSFVPQP